MLQLSELLRKLYEPFTELDCGVFHYKRHGSSLPYVIWAEDGEDGSFHADNLKQAQQVTGIVDLYTKTEFDTLADDIQAILISEGVGWVLRSIDYEDLTGLIHYQWAWRVI